MSGHILETIVSGGQCPVADLEWSVWIDQCPMVSYMWSVGG